MPVFVWQGKTAQGKVLKGEIEATNIQAVFARLRSQRIQPIPSQIREKGSGLSKEINIPGLGPKVTAHDVMLFTRQFSTMIDAGLPIVQSLDILAEQTENKPLKNIIRDVKRDVSGGTTLADALEKHPKAFDELYVNMVRAGEAGGVLNTILNRIALFIEKADKLKKKVKGAMIYPSTIVTVAIGVVAILLIFVIPVFAELYGSMGRALPVPTQITINVSNFFRANFLYLIAAIVLAVVAIKMYYKTPQGRLAIDGLLLKFPVIGDLLRKVAVARFSQNMSLLLASG
ncbi:MAG: type II secretion system F family protein, partial [Candidatus Binatia bacterium]